MTELTEKILLVVGGGLFGSACTYIGAVAIAKKSRRLDANARLYEVFRETIWRLEKDTGGIDTERILLDGHGKQTTAVHQYRFFLSKSERASFMQAWEEYNKKCNNHDFYDNRQKEARERVRPLALSYIYKILKFADYE